MIKTLRSKEKWEWLNNHLHKTCNFICARRYYFAFYVRAAVDYVNDILSNVVLLKHTTARYKSLVTLATLGCIIMFCHG